MNFEAKRVSIQRYSCSVGLSDVQCNVRGIVVGYHCFLCMESVFAQTASPDTRHIRLVGGEKTGPTASSCVRCGSILAAIPIRAMVGVPSSSSPDSGRSIRSTPLLSCRPHHSPIIALGRAPCVLDACSETHETASSTCSQALVVDMAV